MPKPSATEVWAIGPAKWLQKGHVEGRTEGQAALLTGQLDHLFGPLPEAAQAALRAASPAELDRLAERVFTASTLDEAFAR